MVTPMDRGSNLLGSTTWRPQCSTWLPQFVNSPRGRTPWSECRLVGSLPSRWPRSWHLAGLHADLWRLDDRRRSYATPATCSTWAQSSPRTSFAVRANLSVSYSLTPVGSCSAMEASRSSDGLSLSAMIDRAQGSRFVSVNCVQS